MKKTNKPAETRSIRTRAASRERRENERREVRQLILQAAGEEFLQHGYESFSLRRVAERIGYSATTIYLYFQNKDDLLLATVQEGFQAFDNEIKEVAAAHPDPIERIEALGRAYIAFGLHHPALYRLMFMQRSEFYFMPRFGETDNDSEKENRPIPSASTNDSGGVPENAARKTKPKKAVKGAKETIEDRPRTVAMTLLVMAVEQAMRDGVASPGNAVVAADVLWAGAHGLVSLAISPLMSPEHAQQVTDAMLSTLINGIKSH